MADSNEIPTGTWTKIEKTKLAIDISKTAVTLLVSIALFSLGQRYAQQTQQLEQIERNEARAAVGFSDATHRTIEALRAIYDASETASINAYLGSVAMDPSLELLTRDASGRRTPLGLRNAFALRLDALELVDAYATRLIELILSNKVASRTNTVNSLRTNLPGLVKAFQESSDPMGTKFVQPIEDMVGATEAMFREGEPGDLIKTGLQKGVGAVEATLSLVREEMRYVLFQMASVDEAMRVAEIAHGYNSDRNQLTYEQRKARLEELTKGQSRPGRSAMLHKVASDLVGAMMDAHAALSRFAVSDLSPTDFAQFDHSINYWLSRVEYLTGRLRALTN